MIRSASQLRFFAGLLFLLSLPVTYYLLDKWHLQLSLLRVAVAVSLLAMLYVYLFLAFSRPYQILSKKSSDVFWLSSCVFILTMMMFSSNIPNWPRSLKNDHKIKLTLLQINDVYEIVPLNEGRTGGLARVATIRDSLANENPTFTLLAGDFLSPSVIGQSLKGLQMVDVLNNVGVDLVTFGNHEFDPPRNQLQNCINASNFEWISANVIDSLGKTYHRAFTKFTGTEGSPISPVCIKKFTDGDGTEFTVGFFGLTIKSNAGGYVLYKDYEQAAREAIHLLKGRCDALVALTHLDLKEDSMIASRFPEINLIIGGHEHVNSYNIVDSIPIAKADANVKTVYVHTLNFDQQTKALTISSVLKTVDAGTESKPAVNEVVKKWNYIADSLLKKNKYNPCRIVASLPEDFDGTSNVREGPTKLTQAIALAMVQAVPNNPPAFALFNSGSIRLEDILKKEVTEYDVLRVLPYPDTIYVATMPGFLIRRLLNTSINNKTDGSFLQYDTSCIKRAPDSVWLFNGKPIDSTKRYKVAMNGYLLKGSQSKMEFMAAYVNKLNVDTPRNEPLRLDIKAALINYLERKYPPASSAKGKENRVVPCYSY